jgi:UDP-glucuronate 4-epimerase
MALFNFTNCIYNNQPIDLYNYGEMKRDFTFVDDITQGIELVLNHNQTGNEIYNIGFGQQVSLFDFVGEIERCIGVKAITNLLPHNPADALATWSDITKIQQLGYKPTTDIANGIEKFVSWYRSYYN